MFALLCPVYTQLVQGLGRTAQTCSRQGQHYPFTLFCLYAPSSIPFFELHHRNLLQRLVRQVQGIWRLGFHGSRAPLLPDGSSGGDRRESNRKSLNVPISMQGQGCRGRQCSQRWAAVGVPWLHSGPGAHGVAGIWLSQAGAEGQLPLAEAARRVPHRTHTCYLKMGSLASFTPRKLNAPEIAKSPVSCWAGTGTKITHSEICASDNQSDIMVTFSWRTAERGRRRGA